MVVMEELAAAIAANDPNTLLEYLTQNVCTETSTTSSESEAKPPLELFPVNPQSFSLSNNALHLAATTGASTKCLELILQHTADINSTNAQGRTALHLSSFYGKQEVVDYLLQAGCTATYFAAYRGRVKILQRLLSAGCDPDAMTQAGSTSLIVAALNGQLEIISLLLKHSANPNLFNIAKSTAMHTAASRGHIDVVEALKAHGADPYMRDDQGRTPNDILLSRTIHQSSSSAGLIMPTAMAWNFGQRRASVTLTAVEASAERSVRSLTKQVQQDDEMINANGIERIEVIKYNNYNSENGVAALSTTVSTEDDTKSRVNTGTKLSVDGDSIDHRGAGASPTGSTLSGSE